MMVDHGARQCVPQETARPFSSVLKGLVSGGLALWAVLATQTYISFSGNLWLLTVFHLVFLVMLILAIRKPRVDAYSFLAIFLFLGFWAKFVAHHWFNYPFIEPTGDFNGDPGQWNSALSASSAAAAGVVLFRLVQLANAKRRHLQGNVHLAVPGWYRQAPAHLWTILAASILVFYAANFHFAFYVTGVNARLVLPLKLNALFAWAAYCGIAMLVMLLVDWEYERRGDRVWPIVLALGALGLLMSVSLASRASTLFLFGAFVLACLSHGRVPLQRFYRGGGWKWPVLMVAFFAASLTLVSAVRMDIYEVFLAPGASTSAPVATAPEATGATGAAASTTSTEPAASMSSKAPAVPTSAQPLQMTPGHMARQVVLLTIDRWIGLEGMLALSASDRLGGALLRDGLKEDPAAGVDGIYQHIAHSIYVYQPSFTYLTLPGFPVVLFYSGSLLIVLLGMFAATAVICMLDALALRLTGSHMLAAWLGLLLANAICQMSFPYLTMVFMVISGASLVGFWLLTHGRLRNAVAVSPYG